MTSKNHDTPSEQLSQAEFQELLHEKLRQAIRLTLITILEEEVETFLGAGRYQRTPERQDYCNGSYARDLGTGLGEIEDLPVPRTRKGFHTQLFERYHRRQTELDDAICTMFVQGVSTLQVGGVLEKLTDAPPSPSTVSRVFHTLEGEFATWKARSLEKHYLYAFADGTYFSVIYDGEGKKMPILAAVGISETGQREVLGFTVGEHENQLAWEDLLQNLRDRGVEQIDLWITDGGVAMLNALQSKFSESQRQRCVQHKMENVLSYVPLSQQEAVRAELRAIFYQGSREKADQEVLAFGEKYEPTYPTAVACLRRDLESCLTFYAFPKAHWKTIRTSNVIERLFEEVKKRSHKMATAFRNEESCLLMFYAVIRSLKFHRISVEAKKPD